MNLHSQAIIVLQKNAERLARAGNEADAALSVNSRLYIMMTNELIGHVNKLRIQVANLQDSKVGEDDLSNIVTPECIRKLFSDYAQFIHRPDYKELFEKWFFGVPMDQFPPVPVKKEEHEETRSDTQNAIPEGATIFGGDYGVKEGTESKSEEGKVPVLQKSDDREDKSTNG